MRINKHDTNGTKPLLGKGELGYDDYTAGGDTGRVYVGTSIENIALAKKSEVDSKLESVSYTASDVLAKIKTVDGSGSGLDADLLDGMNSSTGNTANTIVARDASGNFTAGTITANLTGNASTANRFSGSPTINGVSFTGAENITITANTPTSSVIKFNSGTTEGTNQYTFNGSTAKTIDFKAGTNVTLTNTAGVVTISANDTSVDWTEIQNKPDPVITVTLAGDTTGTANTRLTDLASGTVNITTVNDKVNGVLTKSIAAASKSQAVLTGGGTITIGANGEVSWSVRFVAIGDGSGDHYSADGFFDIVCPTSGTITGIGGAVNKTATTAGIPLDPWESLYYIPPIGSTNISVPANFRVVDYTSDVIVEPHWIKICTRYGDATPNYVLFTNGIKLPLSSSLNTHTYGEFRSLTADTLTTTRTIGINGDATGTATSFNGSANITIPLTLANSGVTAGTYSKVTVDAKGRVTAGAIPTMEDIPDATFKRSVRCATTANIAATYASNVLTSSAVGVTVIDGITVALNDRILIKNQSTSAHNGIYRVSVLGTASVATVFTRTNDADSITEIASALVAVDSGTVNGGKLFDNDLKTTDTLGTTAMTWSMNLDDSSLLVSTSASIGTVRYNGTVAAAGQFDGGTTTPTGSNRLNYGGYFYPTYLNLIGSGDTTTASSHVFVETGSDGFVRPKTLANFKTEMFASPSLVTPNIGVATGTSFNSITGLSATTPTMNGTAAVGTGVTVARADHVHPTDTSRAPLASPVFTGTPTAPTPTAGDNSTKVATTAFATGQDLGVGQTWQDVSASRAYGVTYTNSTGKPIAFTCPIGSGTGIVDLKVNGLTVCFSTTSTNILAAGIAIVPDGATYSATVILGAPTFVWRELR